MCGTPQREPKIQIPCFQVCRFQIPGYSSANSRFQVSEFPRFERPLCGVRGSGTPISKFLVSSWADSRILLRKFQIPRFRVRADSWNTVPGKFQIPSFRGPLLGPVWRDTQIPDSEFPSFRGPGVPSEKGAALLCMSVYMWETVYGLEDAEESGEVLLPDVVITQTKGYGL